MTYVVIWDGSMKTPLPGVGSIERTGNYLTEHAECDWQQKLWRRQHARRTTNRHNVQSVRSLMRALGRSQGGVSK